MFKSSSEGGRLQPRLVSWLPLTCSTNRSVNVRDQSLTADHSCVLADMTDGLLSMADWKVRAYCIRESRTYLQSLQGLAAVKASQIHQPVLSSIQTTQLGQK